MTPCVLIKPRKYTSAGFSDNSDFNFRKKSLTPYILNAEFAVSLTFQKPPEAIKSKVTTQVLIEDKFTKN